MLQERQALNSLVFLALLGVSGFASAQSAELSGVVRDARGVPQMGVLVEMLGSEGMETALTDLHGHFRLRDLHPGQYDLRTSGAFFSPTVRRGLRVHSGTMPSLNLVLTGWFDEVGSLAPHSHAVGDAVSDWKWTLRSPAARPMLRLAEDQGDGVVKTEVPAGGQRHGVVRAFVGAGGVGQSVGGMSVKVGATGAGGHTEDTLEVTAGSAAFGSVVPTGLRATYESGRGQGVRREIAVSARMLPQVTVGSQGDGVAVLRVDTLQRMEVGSWAALEVGSRAEAVRAGQVAVTVRPMARLSVHPAEGWVVSYGLLSEPGQGWDAAEGGVPTAALTARGLRMVLRQEQSLRVARSAGRVRLEAALTRERASAGVISGSFLGGSRDGVGLALVDTATGTFRRLGPGFAGVGGGLAFEAPVGVASTVAARVLMGPGVELVGAGQRFRAGEQTAVLLELKRSVVRSGTQAAVSYRWQPRSVLTTVGAFEASEVSPYLGVHLRQRLPLRCGEGGGAELTVDASNVLREGYHRVEGPTQQENLLMSALREVRAGVEVNF